MILIQNGDIIAGGGVPVLHMPTADYLANKTALDNTDVFVDITDEPDQLAYADEIGYGDTTLDYVGDIATQALGDVELTDTATKLHTVGSYFVNKAGKYCKTTVQINVGSTIVVGTNCVETSIASETSEIKSDLSSLFVLESYACSFTASAGQTLFKKIGDFTGTVPSGYTPIAITKIDPGADGMSIRFFDAHATTLPNIYLLAVTNTTNATISDTMSLIVLYKKNV